MSVKADGPGFEFRLPLTGERGQVTEPSWGSDPSPTTQGNLWQWQPLRTVRRVKGDNYIRHLTQRPETAITWSTLLVPSLFPLKWTHLSTTEGRKEYKEALLPARDLLRAVCVYATENHREARRYKTTCASSCGAFSTTWLSESFKPGLRRRGSTRTSTTYWHHHLGQITFPLCLFHHLQNRENSTLPTSQSGEAKIRR